MTRFSATYDIESAKGVAHAAAVLAGEQSTGTFIRLAAETDALRDRAAACVEEVEITGVQPRPSLPARTQGESYERGRVRISWPLANTGPSLPNILATVAGNLFELAELSAIRLLDIDLPAEVIAANPGPQFGVTGTRALMGLSSGPMIGTIIKPSVGLGPEETAALCGELAAAGIDFIKDDELQANGPACPLIARADAVMRVLNDDADRSGRKVMFAFNVTGEMDEMRRAVDHLAKVGATCAMVSLFSIGLSGLRALREHSPLPIHAHRNGWGLMSRSPDIGVAYGVWQKLWRLAGADHLHVNGLNNKFTETDESVIASARAVQAPLGRVTPLPVFSSGQTAWQVGASMEALGNDDLLVCAGGGIMSHPDGPAAGIMAMRQAAEAQKAGVSAPVYAETHAELSAALDTFNPPAGDGP